MLPVPRLLASRHHHPLELLPAMSQSASSSKAVRPANATDAVLGAFSNVPPNETLEHLIRYLGTWSGFDKVCVPRGCRQATPLPGVAALRTR